MKTYTIIAGVNGSGKSSLTGSLSSVDDTLGIIIDTDEISKKYGMLDGAKEAIRRIDHCLENGFSFTQETTLSGKKTLHTIRKAKEKGYYIRLLYVAVNSAEESIARIENRVRKGGHNIPEEDVRRRYSTRFEDLKKILPCCDVGEFYDNENGFVSVAEYRNGQLIIKTAVVPAWLKELEDILKDGLF